MYSCSHTLSQISLKNSFGKVVFQILAKIKMTRNKKLKIKRLFGRHFKTVQHFHIFLKEIWFFIVHTYMVQISLQNSDGKVIFLRVCSMEPPLGTSRSISTLVTYARVKGHLEPTHLNSSPRFTFSTKSLGQDSPSIHLFYKIRFTTAKIKLGEDSPSWFVFSRSRFTLK